MDRPADNPKPHSHARVRRRTTAGISGVEISMVSPDFHARVRRRTTAGISGVEISMVSPDFLLERDRNHALALVHFAR